MSFTESYKENSQDVFDGRLDVIYEKLNSIFEKIKTEMTVPSWIYGDNVLICRRTPPLKLEALYNNGPGDKKNGSGLDLAIEVVSIMDCCLSFKVVGKYPNGKTGRVLFGFRKSGKRYTTGKGLEEKEMKPEEFGSFEKIVNLFHKALVLPEESSTR